MGVFRDSKVHVVKHATKISVEGLVVFSEQSQNNSYFFRFENEKKNKKGRKKIPLRA